MLRVGAPWFGVHEPSRRVSSIRTRDQPGGLAGARLLWRAASEPVVCNIWEHPCLWYASTHTQVVAWLVDW